MRPQQALNMFQDVAEQHANIMGIGGHDLLEQSNALWVVTRTKTIFNKLPKANDEITVLTWPAGANGVRCDRNYSIIKDGESIINGISEWVIIDATTRRLRRVETTNYPTDIEWLTERAIDTPFSKLKDDFSEEDFVFEQTVRANDIDSSKHTNNVVYCTLLLNTFSVKELESMTIKEIEIAYHSESREGDTLRIYKQKRDDGYYFAIKNNQNALMTLAVLKFENQ